MFICSREACRGIFELKSLWGGIKRCGSNLKKRLLRRSLRSLLATTEDAGMSLVAVTIVMLIVATLALVVASTMSAGNISSVTYMQVRQAFYLAQAGMEWYLEQLQGDTDWSSPPAVKTDESFGAGTFSVTYANPATDSIDVTATGKVTGWDGNDVQRVITVHVSKSGGSYTDGIPDAFRYVLHSFNNNHINFKDSDDTTVTGDVAASGQVKNEDDITLNGTVTDGSNVDYPSVDMGSYQAIADNIVSGNKTFEEDGTYSGIWYVQGNVTVEEDVTISGTIIATGNIDLQEAEGLAITASTGYPALVSEGNINCQGIEDASISGLIYATGNVNFKDAEDCTINGSVIAGGSINMKEMEGTTVTYDAGIMTEPPPYFEGYETTVTTSSWQESL